MPSHPQVSPLSQAAAAADMEKQSGSDSQQPVSKQSSFKSLGLLDRFLAIWIFLAMAIGIILGNFVPNTGPALKRGSFVGVSIPIGMTLLPSVIPGLAMLTGFTP
jgi:arsenite transporter